MPTSELKINGVTVWPLTTTDVCVERVTLHNFDGPDELAFSERGIALPGSYRAGSTASWYVDGTLRFSGEIVDPAFAWDDRIGGCCRYRCLGLKYKAIRVPVTHPSSGKGEIAYNLPPTDLFYDVESAGMTVGEILSALLAYDQHATDFWNAGIQAYTNSPPYNTSTGSPPVLKSATIADLAALDIVPPEPVIFRGSRLWPQIEALLQDWQGAFATLILADGTIRFLDTRSLTPKTLTMDSAATPIERPSLSRETSDCATRVVVRGDDLVEGAILTQLGNGIAEAFTNSTYATNAAAKAAYKWEDFIAPKGGVDEGIITNVGTTTITVKSSSPTVSWAANKWSNENAQIYLEDPVAQGINYQAQRRVLSNTALSPGGTCTITVDYPLDSSGFSKYRLVGQAGPGSMTYRKYKILNPYVAEHYVLRAPYPVNFGTLSGKGSQITTPIGVTIFRTDGSQTDLEAPALFTISRESTGTYIIFNEPVVRPWNTQANLNAGGSAIVPVRDLRVYIPVSKGAQKAIKPASGFEGKAYTEDGIARTLPWDIPTWRYPGDKVEMEKLAQMLLDTVKDPVIEGTVTHLGYWDDAVTTPGIALSILANGYSTPWEDLNAPVRSVTIDIPPPGAAVTFLTHLNLSTRRRPWTGQSVFVHPGFFDGGSGFAAGGSIGMDDYGPASTWLAPGNAAFGAFGNPMQAVQDLNAGIMGRVNETNAGAMEQASNLSADAMGQAQGAVDFGMAKMGNPDIGTQAGRGPGLAGGWLGGAASNVGGILGAAEGGTSNWVGGSGMASDAVVGGAANGVGGILGGAQGGVGNWMGQPNPGAAMPPSNVMTGPPVPPPEISEPPKPAEPMPEPPPPPPPPPEPDQP